MRQSPFCTPVLSQALDPHAVRIHKRPAPRSAVFAAADGRCGTLEGDVPYRVGDAVVTAVVGERWPVARLLFFNSYDPVPPLVCGEDGDYMPKATPVFARRLDRVVALPMPDGATLSGRAGDWLVQYVDGSRGIVRADIFARTYEPC